MTGRSIDDVSDDEAPMMVRIEFPLWDGISVEHIGKYLGTIARGLRSNGGGGNTDGVLLHKGTTILSTLVQEDMRDGTTTTLPVCLSGIEVRPDQVAEFLRLMDPATIEHTKQEGMVDYTDKSDPRFKE